ncbi:hypothetical protein Y032_0009g552 [Ancylostoma ceylanicum]|uniref:Peptidase S26 domain-containing protein n=1 Tax=Ancylostoma ceylanicum TaxID=53326 RepID=A0A016VIB8_9BILA|nr:hypothetical protein Y032_0009g552 [Ancylostoma ceylanicum]
MQGRDTEENRAVVPTLVCGLLDSPREPDKIHIKRVTAVEGDIVRLKQHLSVTAGKFKSLGSLVIHFRPKHRNELLLVPKGCCWMESDNPVNANDSNIYGPVSRGLMKNRATHVIWPPSRWQRL